MLNVSSEIPRTVARPMDSSGEEGEGSSAAHLQSAFGFGGQLISRQEEV